MKETAAHQDSVTESSTLAGPGRPSGNNTRADASETGISMTSSLDDLSAAEVDRLLASSPGSRYAPELDRSAEASDDYCEIEYSPVTIGRYASVYSAPVRTAEGGLDDSDALRAAHGMMWGAVFSAPLWIAILLILHWL